MEQQHNQTPQPATETTRSRHQISFNRGLRCLGIGIFLMAISFIINLIFFQADRDFSSAMYALTSAGAVSILFGLWCMFE